MKFIFETQGYGGRAMANWGSQNFFFSAPEPPLKSLITVDLPGLDTPTPAGIIEWLRAARGVTAPLSARDLHEIPRERWRPALLDDLMEATNYQVVTWQLPQYFELTAFHAFIDRWLPEALAASRAAASLPPERARAEALAALHPRLDRIITVISRFGGRVHHEQELLLQALEEAQLDALRRSGSLTPIRLLDLGATFVTSRMLHTLFSEVARLLVQGGDPAQVYAALDKIRATPALKASVTYNQGFWLDISRLLRLEPTVSGETIDISAAQEQRVSLHWEVLDGRRVGTIVPGRTALVIRTSNGPTTFIAGERKLKFEVMRAGGQLRRFGNTLTAQPEANQRMHQALLQVDLLDTLANLDPLQALAMVEPLNLPPTHLVYRVAEAAATDPRQARILADLLIELVVGIDADIARQQARAQARATRR